MNSDFYETQFSKYQKSDFLDQARNNRHVKQVLLDEARLALSQHIGMKVLDVGCGQGGLLSLLKDKYPANDYYGTDVSVSAISLATQELGDGITFDINDFNFRVGYADDYFDVIFCGEVIEHLYNTDNFFTEITRILKQDGLVILTTPNLSSWIDRIMLLFGLLPLSLEVSNSGREFGRKLIYGKKTRSESVGHLRCFTWASLTDLSSHYKYNIVRHRGAWFHNFFLNKLITIACPWLSQQQVIILKNYQQPSEWTVNSEH